MKEPPPSRHRKKPSAAAVSSAVCLPRKQQHQLKLVCSFNGAFQFWPPSNKLRYVAGETRIVSVDRNIVFSKLRSRIFQFCLKSPRFSLKYKLPVVSGPADTAPLVSIDCDDDVRCMIEQHDRLELLGKRPRLWIFVCSPSDDDDDDNEDDNIGNNVSDGRDDKTGKNDGAVNYGVDESLRKIFKQKLLAKTQFWGRVPDFESSGGVCKQEYDHPLIDLAPVPNCMITGESNVPGSESYCDLVQYPLDPIDRNMRLGANRFMLSLAGQNFQAWGNGNGIGLGNENQVRKFNVASICNAVGADDAKQNAWDTGEGLQSNLNRENITPWVSVCDSQSCNSLWDRASYLVKSPNSGERASGGYQNGNRSHRVVLNDPRNQRIYPYQIRTHRNNLVEMGNQRSARLDGRLSAGKCYPALGPYSNISKKGQPVRSCCPNSWKPGLLQKVMKGKWFLMDSGSSDVTPYLGLQREQSNTVVSMDGNSNSEEYHLAYDSAGASAGSQSPSCSTVIRNPLSCLRVRDSQQDLLSGPEYRKAEVSDQITYRNCQGAPINNESVMYNQQKVPSISNSSNNIGSSSGERAECNKQLTNTRGDGNLSCCSRNGTCHLQGGIASSVDRLYNLSLSPSKEVKLPAFPSPASNNVVGALPKLGSSRLDLMDEGQLGTSLIDDESNVVASTPLQDMVKVHEDEIYEEDIQQDCPSSPSIDQKAESKESLKCSKVFVGISSDLAAFYTHIATRELQSIKNSDLEYIKELGSGTYGTVYYGKWKGSDVAIKKIKPSCFGGGSLEGDRLVADFWREAHLLGQLHHPNIVAFYGVVTDGPANNLATVTEYMVNGSLKQVLRRKDRTIDRRKRIIITMDAAIGMEYLHEKSIVHFDLKSHNFLVNMRDPQRPVCKIGDLGLSKVKQRTLVSGGVRGTIPWMAPELLSAKDKMVTEKIDVYSFAIVMWELLTGEEPYANLRSEEIIAGIIKGNLRPEIPCWCDPAWRSLMEKCWSADPDCRPAFSEIAKELRSMAATMNIK